MTRRRVNGLVMHGTYMYKPTISVKMPGKEDLKEHESNELRWNKYIPVNEDVMRL